MATDTWRGLRGFPADDTSAMSQFEKFRVECAEKKTVLFFRRVSARV